MNAFCLPRVLPLTFGCAILVASPLRAQQPKDTIRLREIVVTATRLPTPTEQVPNGVTVLRGEELRARGVSLVLDALRETPGAAVVQSGSFGGQTSLFLRGGESNYVRVLVDGVPINEPGGRIDLAGLSAENVERIEIVRGPASVLYGSDAMTGVIQIFTRRGAGGAVLSTGTRAGSYGTRAIEASLSAGSGRVAWSLGASQFASSGVDTTNNAYRNRAASALLRLTPDSRTDAQITIRHHDGVYHFPTDFAGFPSDSNQFTGSRATTVSAEVGRSLTTRLEARLLLGWQDQRDTAQNSPDSPAETDGYGNLTSFRRRSADLRANVRLGPAFVVTAGAVLEEQFFHNAIGFTGSFASGDTVDVSRTNRAAYAQLLAGLGDGVSLTGGVRFDDNQKFGSFGTARAGLTVRATPTTRLRGSAGTAFKEPTFFQSYGGGFSTGNPNLVPEQARSFELGVEQSFAGELATVGAAYFDQHFRDVIQYTFAASPGAPNYRNIAGANARGVELEARLHPFRAATLTARYTYLHTDSGVDGSTLAVGLGQRPRLLRRPTHAGSVTLDGRFGARLRGGATLLFVGTRDDLDFRNADPVTFVPRRVELPAHVRVDAGGEFDAVPARGARPGLALTFRVENLLDARYEEVLYFRAPGWVALVGGRLSVGLGR
ncbi:MAG: TonB-dependent receptor [Gemmatimonadales bacterium]|nr:TonB-dependent receptor [Gemmatimonadales bacterium]